LNLTEAGLVPASLYVKECYPERACCFCSGGLTDIVSVQVGLTQESPTDQRRKVLGLPQLNLLAVSDRSASKLPTTNRRRFTTATDTGAITKATQNIRSIGHKKISLGTIRARIRFKVLFMADCYANPPYSVKVNLENEQRTTLDSRNGPFADF
jgi:hypothetical protein